MYQIWDKARMHLGGSFMQNEPVKCCLNLMRFKRARFVGRCGQHAKDRQKTARNELCMPAVSVAGRGPVACRSSMM